MSFKSQDLAKSIADDLRKRLSFLSATILLTEGADANGDATITIGDSTPATTEKNVFIRVKSFAGAGSLATNSVGLAQEIYSPSVVQIATEAVATNGTFLSPDDLLQLLGACTQRGAQTEWWQETNGTIPTVTTFNTASKLKSTFWPDLYNTMRASQ